MDELDQPNLSSEELDSIFDDNIPGMEEKKEGEQSIDELLQGDSNLQAEKIEFPNFEEGTPSATTGKKNQEPLKKESDQNMELLLDIPMVVSVELGKTSRTLKEILDLSVGSIMELDKLSGEPVDLLVNGKIIAKAEVVVIDENFGIRITQIIDPNERIK